MHFKGNCGTERLPWQLRRKGSACNAGDADLIPGPGRLRAWQPTPAFLPGELHGQRRLVGCSPQGCRELDMTEETQQACTVGQRGDEKQDAAGRGNTKEDEASTPGAPKERQQQPRKSGCQEAGRVGGAAEGARASFQVTSLKSKKT